MDNSVLVYTFKNKEENKMTTIMAINFVMAIIRTSIVMCGNWVNAHPIGFLMILFMGLVVMRFVLEDLEERCREYRKERRSA